MAGRGSIIKRDRVRKPWLARYVGDDRKQHAASFESHAEAEAWLIEQLHDVRSGSWVSPERGRETLVSLWERWLDHAEEFDTHAQTTLSKYETTWRVHVLEKLGDKQLAKVTRRHVEDLRDVIVRDVSAWQATEVVKLVRMLLNFALDEGAISRNPAARVKLPRIDRKPLRVLTPDEMWAIVEQLPERYRAFVLTSALCSLRWSEAVGLHVDDVDLAARTVAVRRALLEVRGEWAAGPPKTPGSARTIDMPVALVKPLREHLDHEPAFTSMDEGLLFTGERGGPVRRHSFRIVWRRACEAAGVAYLPPGLLRHTGASLAYAASKDMKAVSRRLGHGDTRMLDTRYLAVYEETERNVADGIDELLRRSTGFGS